MLRVSQGASAGKMSTDRCERGGWARGQGGPAVERAERHHQGTVFLLPTYLLDSHKLSLSFFIYKMGAPPWMELGGKGAIGSRQNTRHMGRAR